MHASPIVDCHTHTSFSDGASTFEENVRAASAAGCRVLVSTDHLTLPASMDPDCECQVRESELRLLVDRWSAGAAVRLGSVHWIGDPGCIRGGAAGTPGTEAVAPAGAPGSGSGWIDYSENMHVWHELGADGVRATYVDTWCRACESPLAFDVMAHPDLAERFRNEGLAPTSPLEPLWDQMAACARDTGRRIEVSTAGLRKSVGGYYPARGLLERFARAGVPITFGSDAHRAVDICWGIREAQRYAHSCGYRTFDVPHADGSWETIGLD